MFGSDVSADNDFLGAFTAFSAGDYTEARNRLQRLLASQKKHSEWFENLDPADQKIKEIFNAGYLF